MGRERRPMHPRDAKVGVVKSSYATRNWWRTRDAVDRKQKRQCCDGRQRDVVFEWEIIVVWRTARRRTRGPGAPWVEKASLTDRSECASEIDLRVRERETNVGATIKREIRAVQCHRRHSQSTAFTVVRVERLRFDTWAKIKRFRGLAQHDNTHSRRTIRALCSKCVYVRSVRIRATSAALGLHEYESSVSLSHAVLVSRSRGSFGYQPYVCDDAYAFIFNSFGIFEMFLRCQKT